MYKLTKCMLPSMFENMFISTSDVHNYSTIQADLLYVQYATTKRTQRTIKHFETKLWNSLCNAIDIDCALSTFKHRMTIFILSRSLSILYLNVIISLFYYHLPYFCLIILFLKCVFHLYVFFFQFSKLYSLLLHFAPCSLLTTYLNLLLIWTWGT